MRYTTILFDLDGTLTDPIEGITKSVQYAPAKFGIEEEIEHLRPFVGPPLHTSFMKYYHFDEARAREAVAGYREYFSRQGMYENLLFDGIPELLQELRDRGRALCVVTSKPVYYAEQIVAHFRLDRHFNRVVGPDLDLAGADKPTLVREAMDSYPQVDARSFVMIGDREHDIIGAQANGIDSIGVTYGAGSREEIHNAHPTHIAHSVDELGTILL